MTKKQQALKTNRRSARREREARRKRQRNIALGIIAIGIVLLVALVWWSSRPPSIEIKNVSTEQPPGADGTAWGGPEDAAVVIKEYSDFGCPHCGDFALEIAPTLIEHYADNPNVRFEFKPFPLRSETTPPAVAAVCAGQQNMFWPYHDTLFANQREYATVFTEEGLQAVAQAVGLDMGKFNECMKEGIALAAVNESLQEGREFGVTGTPTFFINGQSISGTRPANVYIEAIDAALAEAGAGS